MGGHVGLGVGARRTRPLDVPTIHRLDSLVIDQIAAGEVVERPASILKELVENALDAGASRIRVEFARGGCEHLAVVDDGCGMDATDLPLALERHATSKVRALDDLEAIVSYGFRGEALPSIAAIAQVDIITRRAEDGAGLHLSSQPGLPPRITPVGTAVGTRIDIRELFAKVPARRKFLKSTAAEAGACATVLTRLALAAPGIHFETVRDGKMLQRLPAAGSALERFQQVFGKLRPAAFPLEGEGFSGEALLTPPEQARPGYSHLYLFVNGRYVTDRALARALTFAYGSVIPPGRSPAGALFLALDPAEVDVNVHPQKLEVRFLRGEALYRALSRNLAYALAHHRWGSPVGSAYPAERNGQSGNTTARFDVQTASDNAAAQPWQRADASFDHHAGDARGGGAQSVGAVAQRAPGVAGAANVRAALPGRSTPGRGASGAGSLGYAERLLFSSGPAGSRVPVAEPTPNAPPQGEESPHASARGEAAGTLPLLDPLRAAHPEGLRRFSDLRVVGQVRRMYIVCEGPDGLVILDQHAVDERIHYARVQTQYREAKLRAQALLFPVTLELSEADTEAALAHEDELEALGFEVSRLGPKTLALRAAPLFARRADPEALFFDVLAELTHAGDRSFGDRIDTHLATMACHAAIRAGDLLTVAECEALLHQLDSAQPFQGHCPHGRPIAFEIAFSKLAREVGR